MIRRAAHPGGVLRDEVDEVRPGGDRAGQYSIRINQQWRICFERHDGQPGPSSVEIVDYH
jgi:plasmid maintenance system killer protein